MIVRGTFNQLLQPGLGKALLDSLKLDEERLDRWIEEQERMPIVNPDLSKIPIWRMTPKRLESPIVAYRAWELGCEVESDVSVVRRSGRIRRRGHDYILRSVAVNHAWEGPVVRADMKPIDPSIWDKAKKEKTKDQYLMLQEHTFSIAGIWSVKTFEQVKDVMRLYQAPVCGEIALWGRVAQFTLGYRAEICMIRKLWLDPFMTLDLMTYDLDRSEEQRELKQIVSDLEKRYQCEVVVLDDDAPSAEEQ